MSSNMVCVANGLLPGGFQLPSRKCTHSRYLLRRSGWSESFRLKGVSTWDFCGVRARVRAKSQDDVAILKNVVEEVDKMRAKEIKQELSSLGISYTDCFEKQELVLRLANARVRNITERETTFFKGKEEFKPWSRMPLIQLKSSPNSPKNYILVPLKINDQGPYNFIVDTGSSVSLINPSIVYEKLKLTPQPARMTMALLGGGLSSQQNMSVILKEVKIGDHKLANVSALLMDKQMLQGSASRGECNLQNMVKLATYEVALGILGVKVILGQGSAELALFDLGSSLCVASRDAAKSAGVNDNILQGQGPVLKGGGMGQLGAMNFVGGLIDVGMVSKESENVGSRNSAFTVKQVQFAVGDVPALSAVGCRILLGLNVFKDLRLLFCQSSKAVYLQKNVK